MISIYDYISSNIDNGEVITFRRPRVLKLFTNKNAIYGECDTFFNLPSNYLLIRKEKCDPSDFKILLETENHYLLTFSKGNHR
jgi:hypothetical protein